MISGLRAVLYQMGPAQHPGELALNREGHMEEAAGAGNAAPSSEPELLAAASVQQLNDAVLQLATRSRHKKVALHFTAGDPTPPSVKLNSTSVQNMIKQETLNPRSAGVFQPVCAHMRSPRGAVILPLSLYLFMKGKRITQDYAAAANGHKSPPRLCYENATLNTLLLCLTYLYTQNTFPFLII